VRPRYLTPHGPRRRHWWRGYHQGRSAMVTMLIFILICLLVAVAYAR
jgi:hypothetical protein